MKPLLAGLLATATLALAACYTSDVLLLDPARAVTPLAVGHQTTAGDKSPETVDIALDPDRWYRIKDSDGKEQRVLFTPLDGGSGAERRYAFAEADASDFIYGVAYRRGRQLAFDLPACQGPGGPIAVRHGATVSGTGKLGTLCTFKDAASLIGALRDYAGRRERGGALTRLPAAGE